jgi:hypothetical protein
MITANRRASATIAFFIPRRLAICIAQALSQDHFFERSSQRTFRAEYRLAACHLRQTATNTEASIA